ncbi:hypothetical protein HJD18_01425 [Thermoleophilia bacterium SCSIO 60948]|nr:hypothetical protein HJD18_01425 [Thermoleophilia bacterium SCSIO 60948]
MKPAAMTVGLSEAPSTWKAVRRTAIDAGVPWLADPVLHRTALPGYRTSSHLKDLDFAPGLDAPPYESEEFEDSILLRRVASDSVAAQGRLGVSGYIASLFVAAGLTDPWMATNLRLMREIERTRGQAEDAEAPLLGAVPVRMMGFDTSERQDLLARSISGVRMDAVLLMLDGLSRESSPRRIVSSLRLALAIKRTGRRVLVSRPGNLRTLFLAFGIGVEVGLGRLTRYSVPDFKGSGGGGRVETLYEVPRLGTALDAADVQAIRSSRYASLLRCSCPSCEKQSTWPSRLSQAAQHDAHVMGREVAQMAQLSSSQRLDHLEDLYSDSERQTRKLRMSGYVSDALVYEAARKREALSLARSQGLYAESRIPGQLDLPL